MSRLLAGSFSAGDFEAIVERARWGAAERQGYAAAHLRPPLFPEPSSSTQPEFWVRDYLSVHHIPFEIKLAERFQRKWFRGLDAFAADHASLGIAIPCRVVIHMGEPPRIDPRTFLLPLRCLV